MIRYKYSLILILLTLVVTVGAQQPDRWHDVIIDESTPENAIKILGNPKSDKSKERWNLMRPELFIKNIGKKMRTLHWENIDGFNDVKLKFDNNSKLVVIHLEPKELSAKAFHSSYTGVNFLFGTQEPGMYELLGQSDKTHVFGAVSKGFGGFLAAAAKIPTEDTLIGQVKIIQIISRSLERKTDKASPLLK